MMSLARRLACAATIAVVAAFAASHAQAAPPKAGLTKECHVVSFKDIAKVIGRLQPNSKVAGRTSASGSGGNFWICGADSRNYSVSFGGFCNISPLFGKALFRQYSNRNREGVLSWKKVSGLGDAAVYVSTSHDPQTGGISAGFVVRKAGNVFIIAGHQGKHLMPASLLAALTRKALSNDCS